MSTLDHVINTVRAVRQAGQLPVIVFDLDSTLFNTSGRHLAIVQAFAEQQPAVAEVVSTLGLDDFGWHVDAPLARRGVAETHLVALRAFWFERFFHDDWVGHDLAQKGGPEFVQEVHREGALVYYLTGRDVGGMARGTAQALLSQGYPFFTGRTVLHLKPHFDLDDVVFKDQATADIRSHGGQVVATFENEPGNANLFLDNFPQANHFLIGKVRSPTSPQPRPEIIEIADFVRS